MYLGLDLGTSGLKAVLVDAQGQIIAHHSAPLGVQRPQMGWSEQNPDDWINAARVCLTALKPDLSALRAIGLSGQMHGATCLDKSGDVIRPAILWNDTRASEQASELDARDALKAIFGNTTFAGFTAPKILWMRQFEPQNAERIAKVLLPKDMLRFWLTGETISDMSDASGTAWLDIAKRDWSDELLAASGLERAQMPSLVEGCAPSAPLRTAIADEFGLPKDIVIAGGAGDNAATAIGLNCVDTGDGFLSLGTSGVVFVAGEHFRPDPDHGLHAFAHAIPQRWHQMGVTLSATDCLNWLSRQFERQPEELIKEMGSEKAPTAELFLPFLGGERTPYNSASMRASFQKISHETNRPAMTRAVLEGVSFSMKECLTLLEGSSEPVERLYAVGGGARSDAWLGMLASVLNRPLLRPKHAEHAAAIGAARLGAMARGETVADLGESDEFLPGDFVDNYAEKFMEYSSTIARLYA